MDKKAETVTAQPLGVCEKLYNAFSNSPSLIHLRSPRLTSGSSVPITEGGDEYASHAQAQARTPTPAAPVAKAGVDTILEKAITAKSAGAVTSEKERSTYKVPYQVPRTAPEQLADQSKGTNVTPPAAKANGREVTAHKKEKVAEKVANSVTQQSSATPVAPPVATEKGKAVPPAPTKAALPIATPTAAEKGKDAPPAVPPTVSVKGSQHLPVFQNVQTEKNKVAPASATTSTMEGKKTAPSGLSITNINEKTEDFIRRAKSRMRSISNVAGGPK